MENETEDHYQKDNQPEGEKPSCCQPTNKESKGFWSGLIYGLIPHTGCIAFIIFTILGVTTATAFFRPLLLSRYFFYLLIALSFIFATISALIYLKKQRLLSKEGIRSKWKYLSVLYGTSIGVNLILFLLIFPLAANMTTATPTGAAITDSLSNITLKVNIPCPGHAPLISGELKTIEGVQSIKFRFPDYFDVSYNSKKTSQKEILSLDIFNEYSATKISGEPEIQSATTSSPEGCSTCSTCSGVCGGTCGSGV